MKHFTKYWHERLKSMSHIEKVWERVLLVLTNHTRWFISLGWNNLLVFFQNWLLSFLLQHGLKFWPIQEKGVSFSISSLAVIIKQTYLFLKNLNIQSVIIKQTYLFLKNLNSSLFHFFDLDATILNLNQKFANKTKMCSWCFQIFF